jgi:hypothetical protein
MHSKFLSKPVLRSPHNLDHPDQQQLEHSHQFRHHNGSIITLETTTDSTDQMSFTVIIVGDPVTRHPDAMRKAAV